MPSLSLPPLSIERSLKSNNNLFDPEVRVNQSDSLDCLQCVKSEKTFPKSIPSLTRSTQESVENESLFNFTEEFYENVEKFLEEEGLYIMSPRSLFSTSKTETVVELEKLPAFNITSPTPNSLKIPSILMRRANLKPLKIPQ